MSSSEPPVEPPQPPQYPPQGYPPPGYVPPGYPPQGYPPPGYYASPFPPGYPQQGGYQLVPPPYVPPAVHHVPATGGRQAEFVPAKRGSLIQAWFSLMFRPSRQNFAAWSQSATRNWVIGSILTAAILEIIGITGLFLTGAGIYHAFLPSILAAAASSGMHFSFDSTMFTVYYSINSTVSLVAVLLCIPLGQALFMPTAMGTLRQRYARAIASMSLSLVPVALVTFVFLGILSGLSAWVANAVITTPNISSGQAVPDVLIGVLVLLLCGALVGAYEITMQVQSGAVGAAMNRWAVFGINLLTGLVVGFGLAIIIEPINLIVFSHFLTITSSTSLIP